MKILHVNGADNEGGAAKAATRLLQGLTAQGIDASLYVQRKFGDDPRVKGPESRTGKVMGLVRPTIEETIFGIAPAKVTGPFSAAFLPDGLLPQIQEYAPDILHLHWVARMMRIETLARVKVPIVWTMHDSWGFTGGCYLPQKCTRYQNSCGSCPVLGSGDDNDLSRRVWSRKEKAWRGLNVTLVSPSRWMAERVRESSLFRDARVEVIPNGIDTERYKPMQQRFARELFSLPQDKTLVLFGAKGAMSDPNKGFHLLRAALRELASGPLRDDIELVVFGASAPETREDLGFTSHYLGWLSDDATLALLYSAVDLFVFPSLQESLGYTAMEAMACATPCVAFRQGGVPDLVDHQENGYLASPFDPVDLARGVAWVLEEERRSRLAAAARQKVLQRFSLEQVVKRHLALYRELSPSLKEFR